MDKQSPLPRPAALSPRRLSVASLWVPALLAVALAGCVVDVGDQACTPDSDLTDKDDRCPYGLAGGPRLKIEACNVPPPANEAGCGQLTWDTVYAVLNADAAGGCTDGGCHGEVPNKGLLVPKDNAADALTNLRNYKPEKRGPYLEKGNDHSWMLCNLTAAPNTGGSPMPIPGGLTNPGDIQIVTEWLACDGKGLTAP